jgi:hypothetical protein
MKVELTEAVFWLEAWRTWWLMAMVEYHERVEWIVVETKIMYDL